MSRTTRAEDIDKSHEREVMTRVEEERWNEERINEINKTYTMAYADALAIPPEKIPHGREYFWGRETVHGWVDQQRLGQLAKRGWTPVPASKHPEYCSHDNVGAANREKGYIFNSGLILFERPSYFGDKERAFIRQYNQKVEAQIPFDADFMGVPGMPMGVVSNDQKRSHSASFAN